MEAIRTRLGEGGDEDNTPLGASETLRHFALQVVLVSLLISFSPPLFLLPLCVIHILLCYHFSLGASETLRQFYSRTAAHWSAQVIQRWHNAQTPGLGSSEAGQVMGEKEIKREGFVLAEERYTSCRTTNMQNSIAPYTYVYTLVADSRIAIVDGAINNMPLIITIVYYPPFIY